jgi:hypothetical protein
MKRILRITPIDPGSDTARNTRAVISCSLPLGMHQSPIGALPRNNKKKKSLEGRRIHYAMAIDPSNPSNPLHPNETSVWVARRSGELN